MVSPINFYSLSRISKVLTESDKSTIWFSVWRYLLNVN